MKKQLNKTFYDLFGIKREFSTVEVILFYVLVVIVTGLIFVMLKNGI